MFKKTSEISETEKVFLAIIKEAKELLQAKTLLKEAAHG